MIKTTLGKFAQLQEKGEVPGPLRKLAEADDRTSFAAKVTISRFLKPIVAELTTYQQSLASLAHKYGRPSPEHGGQLVVTGENVAPYRRELEELNKLEIEIPGASPLPEDVVEKVGLTPSDLLLLEDFLKLKT